jgi:putative nucleotidyltransferase with HDIG domain
MEKKDRDSIRQLFPTIEKIKSADLQEKVILSWYHAWKRSNFPGIEMLHQFEPARARIAYTNVEHTNQVCLACDRTAEMLTEVLGQDINREDLMAGAILHDVDKIVIFDFKTGGFTATGRRFAHAVMGASMALMEGLPESVAHIIGAHSWRFSPTLPATGEALILRHLDHVVAQSYYLARGLDMERVLAESLASLK